MRQILSFVALVFAFATLGVAATAKPIVSLKLDAAIVVKDHDVEKTEPVKDRVLRPGEVVRYTISATNTGSDPARHFVPVGRIPVGMAYRRGSASTATGIRAEFSIDGGKTWSLAPVVKVTLPSGEIVERKADPATYSTVRWISDAPLASKSTATFAYEVSVK